VETILSINLIVSNPQVRGGRPCIAGTGLRVSDVVLAHLFHDQTPDEIAAGYAVSLASVHAALAYYYEHKDDIDADLRQQIEKARRLKADWIAEGGTPLLPCENLQVVIADQLKQRGIEAITVRDLKLLGDEDDNHLKRAGTMGYVLCTYDTDYVQLAADGMEHAGIIIGQPEKHWIGEWVKGLTLYHAVYTPEEMKNRLEYL
jgi:uncharacterized protein (DUF433 family)